MRTSCGLKFLYDSPLLECLLADIAASLPIPKQEGKTHPVSSGQCDLHIPALPPTTHIDPTAIIFGNETDDPSVDESDTEEFEMTEDEDEDPERVEPEVQGPEAIRSSFVKRLRTWVKMLFTHVVAIDEVAGYMRDQKTLVSLILIYQDWDEEMLEEPSILLFLQLVL